jgi:hypothetical protein
VYAELKFKEFRSKLSRSSRNLKGPKREIFVAGIFTEIRPVWVGDLETRQTNLKSLCLGSYITLYFLGFLF